MDDMDFDASHLDLPGPDDPVAWSYIQPGTNVVDRDGVHIGSVHMMLGTEQEDIFHGIAIDLAVGGGPRLILADAVGTLTPSRVQVRIAADAVGELPPYQGA
jgi:hypothetical protein